MLGLAGLAILCAVGWWWLFTIPVSEAKLHRLKSGMREPEVKKILGQPPYAVTSGVETWWLYSRNPSVARLIVVFDNDGYYIRYSID